MRHGLLRAVGSLVVWLLKWFFLWFENAQGLLGHESTELSDRKEKDVTRQQFRDALMNGLLLLGALARWTRSTTDDVVVNLLGKAVSDDDIFNKLADLLGLPK